LIFYWVPTRQHVYFPQQWFFWGFSLTFSETGTPFIGDLRKFSAGVFLHFNVYNHDPGYFALQGVLEKRSMESQRIPSIVFCVYQLMFAAITYVFPPQYNSKFSSVTIPGQCWLLAHLQNVLISVPSLFLFSFGQPSFMTLSLTGHGTLMVGAQSLEISILQEVPQSIYLLEVQDSRFHFT